MTTILETPNAIPKAPEATLEGRFFDVRPLGEIALDNLAADMYSYSHNFWLRHLDLLRSDMGVPVVGGLDNNNNFVGLFDYPKAFKDTLPAATKNLLLAFDASKGGEDQFAWSLTVARLGVEQTEQTLFVSPSSAKATRQEFDGQGKPSAITVEEPAELVQIIKKIVAHPALKMHVAELRASKAKAYQSLKKFDLEIREKYAAEKYKKELDKRKDSLKKIGFAIGHQILQTY